MLRINKLNFYTHKNRNRCCTCNCKIIDIYFGVNVRHGNFIDTFYVCPICHAYRSIDHRLVLCIGNTKCRIINTYKMNSFGKGILHIIL